MAMATEKYPFMLNLLLKVGIVALVVFTAFIFLKIMRIIEVKPWLGGKGSMKPSMDFQHLGQEGSICGGAERYPCMPGFVCEHDVSLETTGYGICVKFTGQAETPSDLGEACSNTQHCGAGMRCMTEETATTGTCIQIVVPDLDY